jgi:hypothetical protein
MVEDYSYRGKGGRRHVKRDYFNKSYSNPYFGRQTESKPKFNTKLYVRILLVVFLFYLIFYSDLFKIKNIEVQGTDMINPSEIQALVQEKIMGRVWLVFPRNNLIFFNKSNLSKEINSRYLLDKLEIEKGWRKITVRIEEKAAYLIYNNLKAQYFLDSTGAITKEMSADDVSKYSQKFPAVYVIQDVSVGDKPVSARFVNFILELDKALVIAGIKVKNYEGGGVDQVNLVSPDGWRAYFSLNIPMSQSIENLSAILSQKLKGKKFEYVDLRSGDKVYYK